MKKFILNIWLLALPLLGWFIIVVAVDPFNYFNISALIDREIKENTALKVNTLLYRVIEWHNNPSEYMLTGDSRVNSLPIDEIEKASGSRFKLLNSNAAKLNEIFDLIYLANSHRKIKQLVVGINFNMFNEFGYANRVSNVREILNNPLLYIYNQNIVQACFYALRATITGANVSSTPPMSREEFWKWNLETKALHWYGKYRFPQQLYTDLLMLDSFTRANHIKLTFIIVPHHIQFHDKLIKYGLAEDEIRFKEIMSKLDATVIDYDYRNIITIDKNRFTDPVHFNHEVGKIIVHEVWNDSMILGRKL